jgi:hypothetical protein
MRSGVLDAARVEMEGLEVEGGGCTLGFRLKIDLTPNSPSRVRKKRELENPQNHSFIFH